MFNTNDKNIKSAVLRTITGLTVLLFAVIAALTGGGAFSRNKNTANAEEYYQGHFSGNGSAELPYLIETALDYEQFQETLALDGTKGAGIVFELRTDLTITESIPVFAGTLVSAPNVAVTLNIGWIHTLSAGGRLEGFAFVGTINATNGTLWEIIGSNAGTVKDCTSSVNIVVPNSISQIQISALSSFGGIVAQNETTGTIIGCDNTGNITGSGSYMRVGGITGYNYGLVENCTNNGIISGGGSAYLIGGIVGINSNIVRGCINNGAISPSNVNQASIGGIAGSNVGNAGVSDGRIENCINYGSLTVLSTGSLGGSAGGITASNNTTSSKIINSQNNGVITVTSHENHYAGGIAAENHGRIDSLSVSS
jgi:hypothetical protein